MSPAAPRPANATVPGQVVLQIQWRPQAQFAGFIVMALLILILGPLAALRMPTDIFPEIRIPVIAAAWQYTGLPPEQMAGRISSLYQRALTTTVNDIEHIVANSYTGFGIVKIFFQPGVDVAVANAQVTAISQTVVRQMPPGTQPPLILNYNASTVPILQLALSGKGLSEQNLFDLGVNTVRPPLVTVAGAAIPWPYGGKQRQIQIDLDVPALQARGLSGQDVANALAAQNVLVPVGTQKIGDREYSMQLNNAAVALKDLGDLPCLLNLEVDPFKGPAYPILPKDEVRHVGDAVAFVVADTIDQARDAMEAIDVKWTPLPAVAG